MQITSLAISGLQILVPTVHRDERGSFCESWNSNEFAKHGVSIKPVQDNRVWSRAAGTIRGLHFQTPPYGQHKLVSVLRGAIFDVAVDLRNSSKTFGQHVSCTLDAKSGGILSVPVGFAHGYCTLEPDTEVSYKVDAYYAPQNEWGIRWNDPDLGILWPVKPDDAVISEKDSRLPSWRDSAPKSPF